jgi:hypothetical protein
MRRSPDTRKEVLKGNDWDWDPDAPGEYRRVPLHEALAAVLGHPSWPEHKRYQRGVADL